MKHIRLSAALCGLFLVSAIASHAAQLASAKVLSVTGSVVKYAEDGTETPLAAGDILTQGDGVTTSYMSEANLVFSNGSELTVAENSSITIKELSQTPYSGKKSYEQLDADPSQSQALLELNYGKVDGHVKQLKSGSKFDITTPLGTAAIRGTKFSVQLFFNVETGDMILLIKNVDGIVDAASRFAGSVEYGRGNVGDVNYDGTITNDKIAPIPPNVALVIRLNQNDPYFQTIIDSIENFAPQTPNAERPSLINVLNGINVTVEEVETENNSGTISPSGSL